jgi:hypothetical protein
LYFVQIVYGSLYRDKKVVSIAPLHIKGNLLTIKRAINKNGLSRYEWEKEIPLNANSWNFIRIIDKLGMK